LIHGFSSEQARWLLVPALAVFVFAGGVAAAGPLYDPFLEEFQVGAYLDPEKIDMGGMWPGGLLTPLVVDRDWMSAAVALLTDPVGHPEALTFRFLAHLPENPFGNTSAMLEALAELAGESGLPEAEWPAQGFLRSERWRTAVFRKQNLGLAGEAAELIARGLADAHLALSGRERLVWEMRRRCLVQLAGGTAQPLERPWPAGDSLGPYDISLAWGVWVAHRRAAGQPLLPATMEGKEDAARLAGLNRSFLTPADLAGSAFSTELKAGLGSALFKEKDLEEHLRRYPDPPRDFTVQGWWVKGQRLSRRGNAMHYETLARRTDLKPGWRLDLWRRASELRLLKGQWKPGLQNMDRALAIARQGGGTRSLRRRLRQWVEQAAVLALAQGREETAWELLDKGDAAFTGEAGKVFRAETEHWRKIRTGEDRESRDLLKQFSCRVAAGRARRLAAAGAENAGRLSPVILGQEEAERWELWVRWGLLLADPAPLAGQVRRRAESYAAGLQRVQASGSSAARIDSVLAVVARRFAGRRELLEPFLGQLLDRDIGPLAGWASPPRPSPVPSLLPILRHSQLDMHAALGLALAGGDMRGTVALANELPAAGLTRQEKMRFLYPLPPDGPIRKAVQASRSEPSLILAVARNESLFEPAVRSRAGALGWMQIMPFHFPRRGALPGKDNWAVPAVSIGLGDRILTENRRRFGGDPYLAVAAYNAGPGAAERWRRQLGGSPTPDIYLAWIGYPETRNYVEKVLIDREIYDWILAGRPGE